MGELGLRVCCVVESFDGQATERSLCRLVGAARERKKGYDWTFLCTLPTEGRDEESVRCLGAQVLRAPAALSETARFIAWMRRSLREGQFDVLHCHHDVLSGLYLLAALGIPLRKRIVHVHNTSLGLPTPNRLKARAGAAVLRNACLRLADNIVGVSGAALGAFLHGKPARAGRDLVIPCGVDTRSIAVLSRKDRDRLRMELGVAPSTLTLLFAGRLVESKNPAFCLTVLGELAGRGAETVLLFAGIGPSSAALAQEAEARGLLGSVRFLGWRDDVAAIMNASDVLLWTALESQMEGLGLVVVEAQACGLPIVASRSLPEEAIVVPSSVRWCGLADSPGAWADAVLSARSSQRLTTNEGVAAVDASEVSLDSSASALFRLYDEAVESRGVRR